MRVCLHVPTPLLLTHQQGYWATGVDNGLAELGLEIAQGDAVHTAGIEEHVVHELRSVVVVADVRDLAKQEQMRKGFGNLVEDQSLGALRMPQAVVVDGVISRGIGYVCDRGCGQDLGNEG